MVRGGQIPGPFAMAEKKTRPPVPHEGVQAFEKGLKNEAGTVAMIPSPTH